MGWVRIGVVWLPIMSEHPKSLIIAYPGKCFLTKSINLNRLSGMNKHYLVLLFSKNVFLMCLFVWYVM